MGEKEPRFNDRRTKPAVAIAGVAITLFLNFAHSIWWASSTNAKLDSALESLRLMYPRLEAEARFQAVHQRIDRVERRQDQGARSSPARSDSP
jgi:hypothetical protein